MNEKYTIDDEVILYVQVAIKWFRDWLTDWDDFTAASKKIL
jgi:hypothetical protein